MNLDKKNTYFLILSDISSTLGSSIFFLAMMWSIHDNTKSAFATSVVSMLVYTSLTVFSYLAGIIIDKNNPKKILLISQLCSTLVLSLFLFFNYFTGYKYEIMFIYIFVTLLFSIYSFTNPAEAKLIPEIINEKKITKLFSFRSISTQISEILATTIGGTIIIVLGFNGAISINIIAFLLSFIFISQITYLDDTKYLQYRNPKKDILNSPKNKINIVTKLKKHTTLKYLCFLSILLNVSAILGPLWVVVISGTLRGTANDYGFIQTLGIIGGILASLLIAKLSNTHNSTFKYILLISLFMTGICTIVIYYIVDISIMYFLFPILSFFKVLTSIILSSKVVEYSPEEYRGEISGFIQSAGTAIIPILTVISGYISDQLDVRYIFLFIGFWNVALAFLFSILLKGQYLK